MGDFAGDRRCVTHHACECIQRKADALEGERGRAERLRGALERLQNGPDTLTQDGLQIVNEALAFDTGGG